MSTLKNLSLAVAIIFILSGFTIAQILTVGGLNSSSANKTQTGFVSVEGEFSINLPANISSFSAPNPVAGVSKNERQFAWDTPQGYFMVSFFDLYDKPDNPKIYLADRVDNFIAQIVSEGGAFISKKELSLNGNSGLEMVVKLRDGKTTGINRFYLVNSRVYILTTGWGEGKDGKAQLAILDSFKLIDGKAIIAKKIADATPKPLPQSPVAKKLKSDAEDDNLKGKVKTVVEEDEDLSGTWNTQGRHISSITDFNESGNRIKRMFYDSKALPFEITVYGYINGKRVSNYETIESDDNPIISEVGVGEDTKVQKRKPDPRYKFSFEYKYANGKLIEEKWIFSDGSPWLTYIYNYKGNQREDLVYDEDGKLNQKYIYVLDDKGNEVERTDFDAFKNPPVVKNKYSYKYDSFDEKGNWTKRTIFELVIENGKQISKPSSVDYRTITYYP